MAIIAAAVILVSVGGSHPASELPRSISPAASRASDPAAVHAARAWVALVDARRWDESWRNAADLFRSQVAAPDWRASVEPVRQPLGVVASRTVASTTRTASLPGAPAGDYELVEFNTAFAAKAVAVETVVLTREGTQWKVAGYFVR